MAAWICVCGHNRSQHRLNRSYRGGWDTGCEADTVTPHRRISGSPCPCGEFRPRED